jgi:hypothetical protein
LSCTAGNEDGLVVLDQVVVEPEVFLLSENGVIGLQAVLLQEFLISVLGFVSYCPHNVIVMVGEL